MGRLFPLPPLPFRAGDAYAIFVTTSSQRFYLFDDEVENALLKNFPHVDITRLCTKPNQVGLQDLRSLTCRLNSITKLLG